MTRPSIDDYFLKMTSTISERSTCLRRKVGAVMVGDKHIVSTGYNGSPSGEPHCIDTGICQKPVHAENMENCVAVHAEMNAIVQATLHGVSTKGCTLYCTHSPCVMCRRVLKNAGIVRIVFNEEYK